MNRIWPAQKGTGIEQVFPSNYIVKCVDESLRNLTLDSIDLIQLHVWHSDWTPREEWRRAFEDLKRSGKVRAVGLSLTEHDPDSGVEAIRTGLIDAVQVIYNIFDQAPEKTLLPLCRSENVGVLARVPLDEGGLSGHMNENTKFAPGDFRAFYFKGDRPRQVAEHVAALKKDLGPDADLPEVALRFCLSDPAVSSVIPGMRTRRHAEANAAASDAGVLPPKTLDILARHAWDRNFYQ
jgi:aryl-alcohol dehydrogenase-like predicted oxidoreductase